MQVRVQVWVLEMLLHTDSQWFYANAFFNMSIGSIIAVLAGEDLLPAESIDEGGAACQRLRKEVS